MTKIMAKQKQLHALKRQQQPTMQHTSIASIAITTLITLECIFNGLLRHVEAVSYTAIIPPYHEECFRLIVPINEWKTPRRFVGNYELLTDSMEHETVSAQPLLVYVMKVVENHETVLWSQVGVSRGTFNVKIPIGSNAPRLYWFCLQNSDVEPDSHDEREHPDDITRMIGFTYKFVPDNDHALLLELKNNKKDWDEEKKTTEWNNRSIEIEQDLNILVSHHDYLKGREVIHRTIVEKTFSNVLEYTLLEAFLVVCVSVGQVLYFRRFLENKRYIR